MGDTITVTDDSGDEYRVDEDDLREMTLEDRIVESDGQFVDAASHIGGSRPWDFVIELNLDGNDTRHLFGDGSGVSKIFESAGYEAELLFFETYSDEIYPDTDGGLYLTISEL
jgi:hypothetical protein